MAGKGKGRGPSGRGKPSAKAKGSPASSRSGRGRKSLWLVVFGAVLVAIFVIFAVAQGIGAPSVPAGDAAVVKSLPSGEGSITEAEVKRATGQQVAAAASSESSEEKGKSKTPKPGSKKYEELQEAALGELLDQIWIKGEAEELGIKATPKQIETELKTIKKQNFPTPASYKEFLEKSHFNQQDVNDRVELQILSNEIQEQIKSAAPPVSKGEIQDYYDAELKTQFTEPATRDVRVVVNKDKAKVEAAKKAIEAGGQSEKAWKEAAAKYSSDPTTKKTGGLQKGITEEFVKGKLKQAIFDSATGELSEVVEFEKNFLLIEPVALHAAKEKKLAEVKSQISETLTSKAQETFFGEFVTSYQTKWTGRTYCGSDFLNERCANFKSSGHPATASAACYEEFPKAPAKECPAPVTMNTPAIPGTITETNPTGERLVQRPRPEGLKEGAAAEAEAKAAEEAAALEAQTGQTAE